MSPRQSGLQSKMMRVAALLALAAALQGNACKGSGGESGGGKVQAPPAPVDPVQALYNAGKYQDALPLLEAKAASQRSGTLLYEIGYAKGAVGGGDSAEQKKQMWAQAEPLLESEIAVPGGATLDRLYYLSVINYDKGDKEAVQKFAQQAIDQIEKGPDAQHLSGEDWFRLGRLHEILGQTSEAEAAHRRAVSAFRDKPAVNPTYQALALVAVGGHDFEGHRFKDAAAEYSQALTLVPNLPQVHPFTYALSLLGAGRYSDAVTVFSSDHDQDTEADSQYGADLARKIVEAGGVDEKDTDGVPIDGMNRDELDKRIREAGKAVRDLRVKHSYKPGDTLPGELQAAQKRFLTLLREHFLQDLQLQEFCLREGIADLVRR
jgi:tetratricopeptide (TPR) repeat protein